MKEERRRNKVRIQGADVDYKAKWEGEEIANKSPKVVTL